MVQGSIVKNLCLVSIIYKNKKISFPKNLDKLIKRIEDPLNKLRKFYKLENLFLLRYTNKIYEKII